MGHPVARESFTMHIFELNLQSYKFQPNSRRKSYKVTMHICFLDFIEDTTLINFQVCDICNISELDNLIEDLLEETNFHFLAIYLSQNFQIGISIFFKH